MEWQKSYRNRSNSLSMKKKICSELAPWLDLPRLTVPVPIEHKFQSKCIYNLAFTVHTEYFINSLLLNSTKRQTKHMKQFFHNLRHNELNSFETKSSHHELEKNFPWKLTYCVWQHKNKYDYEETFDRTYIITLE